MFNGFEDETCQSYIKNITKSIRYKRIIFKLLASLLTIFLVFLFSEITLGPSFYYSLGLGWFGFALSWILIAGVWIVCGVMLYLFQSKESNKLLEFVETECDPLRANFIYTELIAKKVFKEEVVCMDLIFVLQLLNHEERIKYLLNKYPKAGQKTSQRANAEFFLLDVETQKLHSQDIYTINIQFLQKIESKNKDATFFERIQFLKDLFYADYLRFQDNYQEAISYYLKAQLMSPLQHVLISYKLAYCYWVLKDFHKAKKELEYVFDHGKSMDVVKQAKEILEKLEEKEYEC